MILLILGRVLYFNDKYYQLHMKLDQIPPMTVWCKGNNSLSTLITGITGKFR